MVSKLLRAAGLSVALVAAPAFAQESSSALERAKKIERDIEATVAKVSPAYVVIGGGSGVIFTPDGWILTNHHVIAGRGIGDTWWVRRPGGIPLRAKLIGQDPRGDIALLKAERFEGQLPYAPLGDSDAVRIGDLAIALGNPYGFARDAHPTVTLGIVSATHTYQDSYSDAIQTDAPINPGNSGGPLLNLKGEVIGINGRVAVRFGNRMNTGVGYAIPANQIQSFLPKLKEGGTVRHGHLAGVSFRTEVEDADGVVVSRVGDSTAAYRAGLRTGDRIVRIAGHDTRVPARVLGIIGTLPAGETVQVFVKRALTSGDGSGTTSDEVPIALKLDPMPDPRPSADSAFLGIQIGGAVEGDTGGVSVSAVIEDTAAAKAGIKAGDVLLRFGGTAVGSGEELIALIQDRKAGDKVDVELLRDGKPFNVTVELGRRGGR